MLMRHTVLVHVQPLSPLVWMSYQPSPCFSTLPFAAFPKLPALFIFLALNESCFPSMHSLASLPPSPWPPAPVPLPFPPLSGQVVFFLEEKSQSILLKAHHLLYHLVCDLMRPYLVSVPKALQRHHLGVMSLYPAISTSLRTCQVFSKYSLNAF